MINSSTEFPGDSSDKKSFTIAVDGVTRFYVTGDNYILWIFFISDAMREIG